MTIAWVIGSNGLLGSALRRVLKRRGHSLYIPDVPFNWGDNDRLITQVASAAKTFAQYLGVEKNWQIYWAAGTGTMASTADELAVETQTLLTVLRFIEAENRLMEVEGSIVFASSAGAIYAGNSDEIINEETPVAPTTDYANEKLRQEEILSKFALSNNNITVLNARISTLYGPGQAVSKNQGLLAHIARCIVRNKVIHIYVPFDTIRDYIATDDAAFAMVAALATLNAKHGVHIKIIASENPTTIAEIISVYKRIARRKPKIVSSASKLSNLYNRRIQFKSKTVPIIERPPKTSLFVGIGQVLASERASFTRSRR